MTVIKSFSRRGEAPVSTPEAAPASEPPGFDAELARELAEAAQALRAQMADIVGDAIEIAFGAIAAQGLAFRSVDEALRRHGRDGRATVHVHPADLAEGCRRLAAEAGVQVEADPLLEPGEVVLESLFGRLHLAPPQLAAALKRRMA